MRASDSFAQIAKLALSSVRGEARPRAKHRFRIDSLEMFEERITPTTMLLTEPPIPFIPPGQDHPYMGCHDASVTFEIVPGTTDTVRPIVTNNNKFDPVVVTFAVYTAPGGSETTTVTAYDNLLSQKLVTSVTFTVPAGAVNYDPGPDFPDSYIDLSQLSTNTSPGSTGSNHLTGQQKFQLDLFCGDFAPTKPTIANLDGILVGGVLGDYDNPDNPPAVRGPGR